MYVQFIEEQKEKDMKQGIKTFGKMDIDNLLKTDIRFSIEKETKDGIFYDQLKVVRRTIKHEETAMIPKCSYNKHVLESLVASLIEDNMTGQEVTAESGRFIAVPSDEEFEKLNIEYFFELSDVVDNRDLKIIAGNFVYKDLTGIKRMRVTYDYSGITNNIYERTEFANEDIISNFENITRASLVNTFIFSCVNHVINELELEPYEPKTLMKKYQYSNVNIY